MSGFAPSTASPLYLETHSQNSQEVSLQMIPLSPLETMLPTEGNLFYTGTTEYISALLLFGKITVYHFHETQNVTATATTQDWHLQVDHAECMPLLWIWISTQKFYRLHPDNISEPVTHHIDCDWECIAVHQNL